MKAAVIDATAGERRESMTAAAQLGHDAGRPILVTGATGQQVGPSCATSARTQSRALNQAVNVLVEIGDRK